MIFVMIDLTIFWSNSNSITSIRQEEGNTRNMNFYHIREES